MIYVAGRWNRAPHRRIRLAPRRFVIVWGAHAPSRAGSGASPEPLVVASLKIFGGGAEDSTRGACAPQTLISMSLIFFSFQSSYPSKKDEARVPKTKRVRPAFAKQFETRMNAHEGKSSGTTVAKQTRMKSTALKFLVLVSFTLALIGCASQPAMTTTTTAQTTKTPFNKEGNGLASLMH